MAKLSYYDIHYTHGKAKTIETVLAETPEAAVHNFNMSHGAGNLYMQFHISTVVKRPAMREVWSYNNAMDMGIALYQARAKHKRFRVKYGRQVKTNLTYEEAAKELGSALLHMLACNSEIDNDGE